MARRMRLTDGDILGLLDLSSDELELEQSDEDIDFEPDLIKNLSESTNLVFLMTEIWKPIVLVVYERNFGAVFRWRR